MTEVGTILRDVRFNRLLQSAGEPGFGSNAFWQNVAWIANLDDDLYDAVEQLLATLEESDVE